MSSLDELRQLARQLNFSEAEIEAFIATHLQRPPTWAEQQSLILAQVNAYLTEILKPR